MVLDVEEGKTREGEAALRLGGLQLATDTLCSSTAEDSTSLNPHYSTADRRSAGRRKRAAPKEAAGHSTDERL